MVSALKTIVAVAAAGAIFLLAGSVHVYGGFAVAAVVALASVVSFSRPLPRVGLTNSLASFLVLTIAVAGLFHSFVSILDELKRTDQARYLRILAGISEKKWLSELKQLEPKSYLQLLRLRDEKLWLTELKELDPATYEAELTQRKEQAETERKVEIQRLKAEAKSLDPSKIDRGYQIYSRLMELEPESDAHKKKSGEFVAKIAKREAEERRKRDQLQHPERFVAITSWSWQKGGFGSIMLATFRVKNELPWSIKDISLYCELSAPSGTKIDSTKHTIFDVIGPNTERTFDGVNLGFIHSQATRASCDIRSVVPVR